MNGGCLSVKSLRSGSVLSELRCRANTGTMRLLYVSLYKAFLGNPRHKQQQQKAPRSQGPRPN